jgi:hypothetical protein
MVISLDEMRCGAPFGPNVPRRIGRRRPAGIPAHVPGGNNGGLAWSKESNGVAWAIVLGSRSGNRTATRSFQSISKATHTSRTAFRPIGWFTPASSAARGHDQMCCTPSRRYVEDSKISGSVAFGGRAMGQGLRTGGAADLTKRNAGTNPPAPAASRENPWTRQVALLRPARAGPSPIRKPSSRDRDRLRARCRRPPDAGQPQSP